MPLQTTGSAVDRYAKPVTLRRWSASGWQANGVFNEAASPTETTIQAVIQSPSEKDMRLLPEGERVEAYVAIWTRTALMTSDDAPSGRADEVVGFDGNRYRIVRVSSRTEGGFTRAIGRLSRDNNDRSL
jgi:hypothetical protein